MVNINKIWAVIVLVMIFFNIGIYFFGKSQGKKSGEIKGYENCVKDFNPETPIYPDPWNNK